MGVLALLPCRAAAPAPAPARVILICSALHCTALHCSTFRSHLGELPPHSLIHALLDTCDLFIFRKTGAATRKSTWRAPRCAALLSQSTLFASSSSSSSRRVERECVEDSGPKRGACTRLSSRSCTGLRTRRALCFLFLLLLLLLQRLLSIYAGMHAKLYVLTVSMRIERSLCVRQRCLLCLSFLLLPRRLLSIYARTNAHQVVLTASMRTERSPRPTGTGVQVGVSGEGPTHVVSIVFVPRAPWQTSGTARSPCCCTVKSCNIPSLLSSYVGGGGGLSSSSCCCCCRLGGTCRRGVSSLIARALSHLAATLLAARPGRPLSVRDRVSSPARQ